MKTSKDYLNEFAKLHNVDTDPLLGWSINIATDFADWYASKVKDINLHMLQKLDYQSVKAVIESCCEELKVSPITKNDALLMIDITNDEEYRLKKSPKLFEVIDFLNMYYKNKGYQKGVADIQQPILKALGINDVVDNAKLFFYSNDNS